MNQIIHLPFSSTIGPPSQKYVDKNKIITTVMTSMFEDEQTWNECIWWTSSSAHQPMRNGFSFSVILQ